jgi:serine/threonine protein kinase/Tfp pilus assembly protein PilF
MLTLEAGTRLAQYEVLEPLGAGGMGEVYRARDSRLERDVAIKVLPQHLAADPDMRGRFEREMRAVAALTHPGIMSVFELAKVGDLSFAVVELLDGETLRKRLAAGVLPWQRAASIGADLADALAAAHAKGIVHRDVKPENIVITADGRTKLLDFGLARSQPDTSQTHATVAAITSPGLLMGTIGYIAPEQIRGETATPASDIFATGCVLYEMVTGRMPFARATAAEVMAAVLKAEPQPIGESGVHAPQELQRVITHCLAKHPQARFRSARDLALALRALTVDSGAVSVISPTPTRTRKPAAKAVAVLPFENLTGNADADYLCDGLTESVINCLSQLPKLRVVPRSTVFRYKGRLDDLASIALALNVRSVVTGRVANRGGKLNIQAELVDTFNDSQVWGDQYLREGSDVASLQQEIAFQISESLRLRLTPEERKRLKRTATTNEEAYQAYLRGRYHWNRWTPDDFKRAMECFEKAIQIDPNYALAWSGLGDAYGTLGFYGVIPTRAAMAKAKPASLRALELDPTLAEAHVTMAFGQVLSEWNWARAEKAFVEAIRLNPRHAPAHAFYGLFSVAAGETEDGIARALHGRDLDPLSTILNLNVGWAYLFAHRFDEAIAVLRQTLELDPAFRQAQSTLCAALQYAGRHEEAAHLLAEHNHFWGAPLKGADALPGVLAHGGVDAYYLKLLALMEEAGGDVAYPCISMAIAHVFAGHTDEALKRLERIVDQREGHSVFFFVEPGLDPVRGEPRFEALLTRLTALRSAKAQHDEQGARL